MKETWKPVGSWYEVSDQGRIRNVYRGGAVLNPRVTKDGYRRACLYGKDYLVHRLIAEAFHPNPHSKAQVDHDNGIRDDNRACNLKWATISENLLGFNKRKDNTSGSRGVSYNKTNNKWGAYCTVNKKRYSLGHYTLKEDAIKARLQFDKARVEGNISKYLTRTKPVGASGVVGVYQNQKKNRWIAKGKLGKKTTNLGYFATKAEAAKARKQWEQLIK